MIIDQLNIFTDQENIAEGATSKVVSFMPFIGRDNPCYLACSVGKGFGGKANLEIILQESKDKETFTDVGAFTVEDAVTQRGGANFFSLPLNLKEKYVRLKYKLTGASEKGTLFTGISLDALLPYTPELSVDSRTKKI